MKRILVSIGAAAIVPMLAWIGGYDFDERGGTAILVAYFTLATGVLTYLYPGWTE